MRLEDVTAEIRPRSDWEAVDLGFAMARRDFWRCLTVWWLAVLIPSAVGIALLWDEPGWFLLLFWWWRPAATRMVLFELSRRLFGEKPTWKQVWPQFPRAWSRRFGYRFLWARFSPWSPITMAVEDLEGLRGRSYGLRSRLLLRRGEGACFWLAAGGTMVSAWLAMGLLVLLLRFVPESQDGAFGLWMHAVKEGDFTTIPLTAWWMAVAAGMLSMSLTDVFVTGGGFGIYVNNRTWIEGWDVELAFKRLVNRIGKAAALIIGCAFILIPQPARAAAGPDPESVIREVKADHDFEIQKRMVPEPESSASPSSSSPKSRSSTPSGSSSSGGSLSSGAWGDAMAGFGNLMLVILAMLLLGGIAWLIWRYRDAFTGGRGGPKEARVTARVVMGMEVSPDSLPEDVPTTAWRWWNEGRRHEALALLYRGAISKVIEVGRVEIAESDTEGDCLRRVNQAGPVAHPGYFSGLTGSWIGLAYARTLPADVEVESLCRQWPYVERRSA